MSWGEVPKLEKLDFELRHLNLKRWVGCQIGPRMELEVVKVEEGMCSGRVLYHSYVQRYVVFPVFLMGIYQLPTSSALRVYSLCMT